MMFKFIYLLSLAAGVTTPSRNLSAVVIIVSMENVRLCNEGRNLLSKGIICKSQIRDIQQQYAEVRFTC